MLKCLFGYHNWDGCKCTVCGKTRDKGHVFNGCTCEKCGKVEHEYEVIDYEEFRPDCIYAAGEPCTGPGCCEFYPGPGKRIDKVRCRKCGHETTVEYNI